MSTTPLPATAARQVYTPTALTRFVRDLLEDTLPLIWVEGEISNFSRPASGHLYFTLKDAGAQVRCAMFRPKSTWLRFKPGDGLRVLARARVSLYEARGEFQLIVESLEEAGAGALQRAFDELKTRLAAEGLFDAALKRAFPRMPLRIGVITSPSGAAVRDVRVPSQHRAVGPQVDRDRVGASDRSVIEEQLGVGTRHELQGVGEEEHRRAFEPRAGTRERARRHSGERGEDGERGDEPSPDHGGLAGPGLEFGIPPGGVARERG